MIWASCAGHGVYSTSVMNRCLKLRRPVCSIWGRRRRQGLVLEGRSEPKPLGALSSPGSGGARTDRRSVVSGKSGSVRVDLGGRRNLKKRNTEDNKTA